MIDSSEVRARLADNAPVSSFRDLAGYFSLVVLCRTYTKLSDYGIAIQYAHELGVQGADGLFARTPRVHASLALYAGFALLMSRRFDDALRVLARALAFLHRSLRVLDDKELSGASGPQSAAGAVRVQVRKMLLLVAVCVACCPGVDIDENVRRTVAGRHRELMDQLVAGGLTVGARAEGGNEATQAARSWSIGAPKLNSGSSPRAVRSSPRSASVAVASTTPAASATTP